jgi:hypothetical protein
MATHLPGNDPAALSATDRLVQGLSALKTQAQRHAQATDDPRLQSLSAATADVLGGLLDTFGRYDEDARAPHA